VGTWRDPDLGQPIAAPLQRFAELLGVDLATIQVAAANVEPYLRADGTRIWSLMQLERQLGPEVYGLAARRPSRPPTNAAVAQSSIGPPWMTGTFRNHSQLGLLGDITALD
jgi:hypothetical protein